MENYKLKHLSKYCCKPANQLEFEAVKMAAEIGGVEQSLNRDFHSCEEYIRMSYANQLRNDTEQSCIQKKFEEIPCLDFINKLRMSEEKARELEDDRVVFNIGENWCYIDGCKGIESFEGHYFKTNEDGTEVTLHKR